MAENKKGSSEESQNTKVNRREFLNVAWLASLGFLALSLGGVTYLFAMPRFKEGEFGGVITVGDVSDIPPVEAPPENNPSVKYWLSNTDEGVTALYTVCTHLGCLYGWREQENKFVCPCHGSQFDKDGDYILGPAPRSLDRFAMRAIDPDTGDVIVESADGSPMPLPDDPNAIIQVDTGKRIKGDTNA